MNTCSTCKHWAAPPAFVAFAPGFGECGVSLNPQHVVSGFPAHLTPRFRINAGDYGRASLLTRYDFGCTEWSAKETNAV